MRRRWFLCLVLAMASPVNAAELRLVGVLGNSGGDGDTLARFSGKPATGMGPVFDRQNTVWERGGSTQLNRYALDGRLLASFPLPDIHHRNRDQLTLVGDTLLLKLGKSLYRLPVSATAGTKPERLPGNAEVLSSSSFAGRAAIYDAGQVLWLDAKTGERTAIAKAASSVHFLFVDGDGTVFGFGNHQVQAWKEGQAITGYPRPFRGARPQKIGDFWYSHADHGTIFRYNAQFEPDPGVVAGGASGSFIGYLPRSVDITHGVGIVPIRDDLVAVSGFRGVVQILQWRENETQFEVVRRIGPLFGLEAVALDADGNIWTPFGSWRWSAAAETPLTQGDVMPSAVTQPVVVGGKSLCFVKQHYSYVLRAHGPLIDEHGWAHMETRGVKGLAFDQRPKGATGFTNLQGKRQLLVTDPTGKATVYTLLESGQISEDPVGTTNLPGLQHCTSLAWLEGHLLAADRGALVVFSQTAAGWEEKTRHPGYAAGGYVQSDGQRIVVSDVGEGRVQLFDSLDLSKPIATLAGLSTPTHVAVSGDRVVVYESGKQRLLKLEFGSLAPPQASPTVKSITVAPKSNEFRSVDFVEIGKPGGLPVAVAIREQKDGLLVALKVPDAATKVLLGAANDQQAYVAKGTQLRLPAGDRSNLRLAVSVNTPQQQERLRFVDGQPIHAPFSKDPQDWAPFDLNNYHEIVAERREQIRIEFQQPADGKATLVIENEAGQRIRNLVSGRSFGAGDQTVVWDGLDENGQLVAPGTYRWRGVAHPGIKPDFRMTFAGGREPVNARPWGPNHGLLHSAVSDGQHVYFAASVTEGGWALVALDADGKFVQGYEHQHGFGIEHDAIAVDDKYLYCAQDGFIWGGHHGIDWKSDQWKSTWNLTVVRYDLKSGRMVEFPKKQRAIVADTLEVGPGSLHPDLKSFNLGGLAAAGGRIYVGSRGKQAVLVFDSETGKQVDSIPMKNVRHLASDGDTVFAATDAGVFRVKDGQQLVKAGAMELSGLTIGPRGDLWVSDGQSHQIHRFTTRGELVETLGKPGGPYKGRYDPDRMVNPAGLTFGPEGKMWVTEKRWNPKRVLAWDLEKKSVVYEKFGIPHYGGDGSGFDPQNARRWIGLGCFWDVDLEAGTARPTHIMALEEAHFQYYHPQGYSFFREAGRTFLCARGKIALICEVLKDGTIREIAACCGTHHFAYGCNWKPPQAYIDAFYAKWPEKRKQEKPGKGGEGKPWAGRVAGVLWVDRNADGQTQQDEFTFTEEGVQFADGVWGHRQNGLTLRFPAAVGKQVKIVEIQPKGFLSNGIPDYPTLEDAVKNSALDVSLTPGYQRQGVSTAGDRFGRFVLNSAPELNAYDSQGKQLWTYPSDWSGVHGSHKAPLPETGVLQGALGILGMAPFDDQADVFFLNGNHGRCFLLTSDGIYLDEAFTDVRVSYLKK